MIIPPIREMTIQELEKLGWYISDEGYERILDEAENDDPRIGEDFFETWLDFFFELAKFLERVYFEQKCNFLEI